MAGHEWRQAVAMRVVSGDYYRLGDGLGLLEEESAGACLPTDLRNIANRLSPIDDANEAVADYTDELALCTSLVALGAWLASAGLHGTGKALQRGKG